MCTELDLTKQPVTEPYPEPFETTPLSQSLCLRGPLDMGRSVTYPELIKPKHEVILFFSGVKESTCAYP